MNLYSYTPYWLIKNGISDSYKSLDEDISVDIAIIGAGISGALVAYHLRNAGSSIAIFDRRHVGMGSTAASTAFLQYEIDKPMRDLTQSMSEQKALACYKASLQAVENIGEICGELGVDVEFKHRPSLQYASYKKDIEPLYAEFELRMKHGFDVQWLEQKTLQDIYGLEAPAAIVSKDAGEVDAYMLTHALCREVCKCGHKVYNNTNVASITHNAQGIMLTTTEGDKVKARKLIIACGYESQKYVPKKVADIYSTYTLVSEPVSENKLWRDNCLAWETALPYLYFRVANGNRILVGGKDDKFYNPDIRNSRVHRKSDMLIKAFAKRMKFEIKPDFSWAGAFAVTKDGLPYIGSIPEYKNTYFALGYGGNGITFSAIAAAIIRDDICGKLNKDAELFSFRR